MREELAYSSLHRNVETKSRFVKKKNTRLVDQSTSDLDLHPLSEREITDRFVNELFEIKQFDELVDRTLKVVLVEIIDGSEQLV